MWMDLWADYQFYIWTFKERVTRKGNKLFKEKYIPEKGFKNVIYIYLLLRRLPKYESNYVDVDIAQPVNSMIQYLER
jgi:hypothetical protein